MMKQEKIEQTKKKVKRVLKCFEFQWKIMRVNSLEYVTKQIWWGREGRQKRPHEKQKVRDST